MTSLAVALSLGFVALSSTMWFSQLLYGVFEDDSADDQIEMNERPQVSSTDNELGSTRGGEMT